MRDIPTASFLMCSLMVSQTLTINWWGTTNIRMSAPFTDSARSGTATCHKQQRITAHKPILLWYCSFPLYSPHWGAACDPADISHFHGLCWWFLWVFVRLSSPQKPTCSQWCQRCHIWRHWHPLFWRWQSPCYLNEEEDEALLYYYVTVKQYYGCPNGSIHPIGAIKSIPFLHLYNAG